MTERTGEALRCLVLGDSNVGKTSLVNIWTEKPVPSRYSPTLHPQVQQVRFIARWAQKPSGEEVRVDMVDTAGVCAELHLESLARGVSAVVMVFDVTREETFLKVTHWTRRLKAAVPSHAVFLVVGNKNDLTSKNARIPKVSMTRTRKLCQHVIGEGTEFLVTSCTRERERIEYALPVFLGRIFRSHLVTRDVAGPSSFPVVTVVTGNSCGCGSPCRNCCKSVMCKPS